MDSLDYTFVFKDITERFGQVKIIDHVNTGKEGVIQVAIKDMALLSRANHRLTPLIADLIDTAIAVHLADRMSVQKQEMPRRIKISLPIRRLDVLGSLDIQEKFQEVLQWYTDDFWFIEFRKHAGHNRISEMQMCLNEDAEYPTNVALWSGGLDALAGAYTQLKQNIGDHYTLFGTGSNLMLHKRQRDVAASIENAFPGRTQLIQLPIYLNKTHHLAKDSNLRSRGFVFILLGVACAALLGQNSLHIYENGVGAINLPFTKAEVGLDHSRSVHPLSLLYMSELVSSLFEKPFSIRNPFLFSTKAQMCNILSYDGVTDLIFQTISCDHRHRRKPSQCGYCSSCLLRRQALAALGLTDQTSYLITLMSRNRRILPDNGLHLRAMLSQVKDLRILLGQSDPWERFSDHYPWLREIVDRTFKKEEVTREVMVERLLHLYESYIHEWDIAIPIIGPGLLSDEDAA